MPDRRTASLDKIRIAAALMLFVSAIGVTGYMLIEGLGFLDALYMTIITIATVGFKEVKTLSDPGKLFTIFLIVISWGTFAYAISVITTHLVEGEVRRLVRGYRIKSGLKKMKDHVIVCGYGRNGQQAINELRAHKHTYVVIDQKSEVLDLVSEPPQNFIKGDATEDEVLVSAGVKHAKALITTLPIDADNLFVVLTARSLNPNLLIISRATDENAARKLRVGGVDNIVLPEKVGGAHMAMLVARRDVLEFLDHLSIHGNAPTNLEEIECNCLGDELRDRTIYDIGIRKKTGANIVGYKTAEGEFIINPTPDTLVSPDSKLFVLGTPEQIAHMKRILSGKE